MLIGEKPGKHENHVGRPFLGDSGQELDGTYLEQARLERSEVYVTNTVKCWSPGNRTPTDKEALACATHHLPDELARVQPELVILLGGTACSLASKHGRSIDLIKDHGLIFDGDIFGWSCQIFPAFHPAAGLRQSSVMQASLADWRTLRNLLKGFPQTWQPDFVPSDYAMATDASEVSGLANILALDTEFESGVTHYVQVSDRSGWARMIRADDEAILAELRKSVKRADLVILHHSLADLDGLEALGIHVREYDDTMQMAYHRDLPQGLKDLAYRLCGMEMEDYTSLVSRHLRPKLRSWIEEKLANLQPTWIKEPLKGRSKLRDLPFDADLTDEEIDLRLAGKLRLKQVEHPEAARLKRALTSIARPNAKLKELAAKFDGAPRYGISAVPLDELVLYGCRDPDATLRCWRSMKCASS